MQAEAFSKLTLLKHVIGQMSIADKIDYVKKVSSRLDPDMLKTSDGDHAFSAENILSVALGVLVTKSRNEFEAICGLYRGGYKSALRAGVYHGKGDIPNSKWRKEIRRLHHNIREHIGNIKLPPVRELACKLTPTGSEAVAENCDSGR